MKRKPKALVVPTAKPEKDDPGELYHAEMRYCEAVQRIEFLRYAIDLAVRCDTEDDDLKRVAALQMVEEEAEERDEQHGQLMKFMSKSSALLKDFPKTKDGDYWDNLLSRIAAAVEAAKGVNRG